MTEEKPKQDRPDVIRFNEEDKVLLASLGERTGLSLPNVVRLALRALDEKMGAAGGRS